MSSTLLTFPHLCDPVSTVKNFLLQTVLHRSPEILATVKQMMTFLMMCLLLKLNLIFLNQSEFNDLIRDFGLTKSNAEILIYRLKEWNLLDESCRITTQRERHKMLSQYFTHCR